MKIPESMEMLTSKEWQHVGVTRAQFEERWKNRLERDLSSPPIGSPAPDFELKILSREGIRTGKSLRLSTLFGRPIGLIFGSYT